MAGDRVGQEVTVGDVVLRYDDLADLVGTLSLAPLHLLGHSMGGIMARRHLARV
jgi:pimeloyl-ACP methyl ester carboxylesterase